MSGRGQAETSDSDLLLATSTETRYEVDVREEPFEQAESDGPGGPVW